MTPPPHYKKARRLVVGTAFVIALVMVAFNFFKPSKPPGADASGASSAGDGERSGGGSSASSRGGIPAPTATARPGEKFVRDRERANQIREAMREAWLRGSQATSSGTREQRFPHMPTGPNADGGDALRTYLREAVRSMYFPLARQCYQSLIDRDAGVAGRISLDFAIAGDDKSGGIVDHAEFDDEKTTLIDPEFRTCLRESMLSVVFDAPPNNESMTVSYPIEFTP